MKNGKPRGPVPSLIGSTLGTPRRVLVEKKAYVKDVRLIFYRARIVCNTAAWRKFLQFKALL